MEAVILTLVIIGIILAITSGVWVAIALVRAISARRAGPAPRAEANQEDGDRDIQ